MSVLFCTVPDDLSDEGRSAVGKLDRRTCLSHLTVSPSRHQCDSPAVVSDSLVAFMATGGGGLCLKDPDSAA